jgi:hypothetical protein
LRHERVDDCFCCGRAPRHLYVVELVALQAEYAAWLDHLPQALRDGDTGEALQAIVDRDLDDLVVVEPPRGYGRD